MPLGFGPSWDRRRPLEPLYLQAQKRLTMKFQVKPCSLELKAELEHKINTKTKPVGSLGKLEEIALRMGLIQNTISPEIKDPHILVFAGDHGLSASGVSAFPAEVTPQMVLNFLNGGAAINAFSSLHEAELMVIDAGVNYDFENIDGLVHAKVGNGTANCLTGPAMSAEQAQECLEIGWNIVADLAEEEVDWIGFGEMGIGNTAIASLFQHYFTGADIANCVGPGTGLDADGVARKKAILKAVIDFHGPLKTPMEILEKVGGFELGQMAGAMISCAFHKVPFVVDGYISTAAYLLAFALAPEIKDYSFFAHSSQEPGHEKMVQFLDADPILQLNLRLGEGTGAALSLPIFKSALQFLNYMSSFETAGVSDKTE
ncbi:MAG: nicotinate-nucleotide--dimethylbenzimidazole phosphoribosyltransferase [Sphingobacteriales bacterium]|jgi:nicotinate-nucleotide--dimethylbenzimidazole phosphoribosyltransferase